MNDDAGAGVQVIRNDIQGLKQDIAELKTDIRKVLDDHEQRLRFLEKHSVQAKVKNDHEKRIRDLETAVTRFKVYFSLTVGAAAVIQVLGYAIIGYLGG